MQPEDSNKVNLSSVNKKSKNSTKNNKPLKNLFKKQPDIKRDDLGKFTSGSGGLKSLKNFNLKRALPLILVVALVGGLFVWRSFAADFAPQIQTAYQTNLGRPASSGDIAYWTTQLGATNPKWTVSSMNQFIASSAEGQRYKASKAKSPVATTSPQTSQSTAPPTFSDAQYSKLSDESFVKTIYIQLLGGGPDSISLKDWVTRLSNKSWSRAQVYSHIASSQGATDRRTKPDEQLLDRLNNSKDQVAKYKEAIGAFQQHFVDQFFAALSARGGILGESKYASGIKDSCNNELIPGVKSGALPAYALYPCMPLVGLAQPTDPDSYAIMYARGSVSIGQAISEMDESPAIGDCDQAATLFFDCFMNNRRSIYVIDDKKSASDKTLTTENKNLTDNTSTKSSTSTSSTPSNSPQSSTASSSSSSASKSTTNSSTNNKTSTNSDNPTKTIAEQVRSEIKSTTKSSNASNVANRDSTIKEQASAEITIREKNAINSLIIPKCNNKRTIRANDKGECVKRAQQLLGIIFDVNIRISGKYDKVTATSVKTFQKTRGIPVTGTVNAQTWRLLEKALDTSVSKSPLSPARGTLSSSRIIQ